MLPERLDLEGADDDQLDLFYLVDRVLDEIELAKQAAEKANESIDSDDTYNMPAAIPEFDTYDLMDQIDIHDSFSDQSFSPHSSSFEQQQQQSPEMQHIYQQHPAPINFSTVDVIGSSNQDVESAMNQIQMLNQYEKDNLVALRNNDYNYPHNFFSCNSNNVSDIVPSISEDHINMPDSAEANIDLTDIPEFNVRYTNIPGAEIPHMTYDDENSNDTYISDLKGWTRKHPESWTSSDVLDWLIVSVEHIAENLGEESSKLKSEAFTNVTGDLLCRMGPEEFYKLDPIFGLSFYQQFRRLLDDGVSYTHPCDLSLDRSESNSSYSQPEHQFHQYASPPQTNYTPALHHFINNSVYPAQTPPSTSPELYTSTYIPYEYCNQTVPVTSPTSSVESVLSQSYQSSMKSYESYNAAYNYQYYRHHMPTDVSSTRVKYENGITPARRRPGRPRTKNVQSEEELQAQRAKKLRSKHLWEFIYELLNDPNYNPKILKWENQANGVFKFIQSELVAQLWGTLKSNQNMTYEKLSRAMRHYYKRGIMERVEGRRLVYKYSLVYLDKMREKYGFQTT